MQFQFIGTGNAAQVPCYGCDCTACTRAKAVSSYRRGPCSARVQCGEQSLLIDAGMTNLTERFPPGEIGAILLTHYHMDHVQGLFHLRWGMGHKIPVIGPADQEGCDDLFKHPGILHFLPAPEVFKPFYLKGLEVTPVPLNHSKPTVGYVIDDGNTTITYLTDTLGLPEKTMVFLKQFTLDIVVLDCSSPPKPNPRNHNTLVEALDIIHELNPAVAYLTHISHELDCYLLEQRYPLPNNVKIASDNLLIDTQSSQENIYA